MPQNDKYILHPRNMIVNLYFTNIHVRANKFGGRPRVYRVAQRRQLIHPSGNPISQQTKSGFSTPAPAIGADIPVEFIACRGN